MNHLSLIHHHGPKARRDEALAFLCLVLIRGTSHSFVCRIPGSRPTCAWYDDDDDKKKEEEGEGGGWSWELGLGFRV